MGLNNLFKVSVIIPVYNVAHFVEEAVQSALLQPEVGEVILVEDGSTDNSFQVCKRLCLLTDKVRLLTHPNRENKGVCKSRNLGILSARFDFIAFLDADDWYLPNRFVKERSLFKNPAVMAVYSLSAIKFPDGREDLFGCRDNLLEIVKSNEIPNVYCYIMKHNIVLGHTNSNTFRKAVFESIGFFDERLELHQDSEMWYRIARNFLFWSGELTIPVSFARRHNNNRITNKSKASLIKLLYVWIDNIGIKNIYPCEKDNFIYLYSRAISNPIKPDFFRKIVFYIIRRILNVFRTPFINYFYSFFKLKRLDD